MWAMNFSGLLGMTTSIDKRICFEIDILQIYSTTEEYFQLDWKIAKNFIGTIFKLNLKYVP
jgi:hypothetical protein